MEVPPLQDESGLPDDPLHYPDNINITRDETLDKLKEKEKTTVDNLFNAKLEYDRLNDELKQIRADIAKISKQNNTKRSGGRRRTNKRRKTNKKRTVRRRR